MKTPPPSDSESSPSLTIRTAEQTPSRRKSSIFSKLRKSILPNEQQGKLKRTSSFDSSLQKRLSELRQPDDPASGIDGLLEKITEKPQPTEIQVTQSQAPSPTTVRDEPTTESTSIFTLSATNFTISRSFQCAWLAPTRRLRLYQGELSIIPKTAIYFQATRLGKPVRLFIGFQDILNIADGSWNGAKKQALIVDLTRVKKRNFIFVGWREGELDDACREIVHEWNRHNLLKLRTGTEKQKSLLSTKYQKCCAVEESTPTPIKLHAQSKSLIGQVYNFFHGRFSFPNNAQELNPLELRRSLVTQCKTTLKNVLLDHTFRYATPDILIQILSDQASAFMTNLRAIQGHMIISDSGWSNNGERSFTLLAKLSDAKLSKWQIKQSLKQSDTDFATLKCVYSMGKTSKHVILYEAKRVRESAQLDFTTRLTISTDSEVTEGTMLFHLKHDEIPTMTSLLAALLEEAEFSFEADSSVEQENPARTERFLLVMARTWLRKADLYFTTALLPIAYTTSCKRWFRPLMACFLALPVILLSCRHVYELLNAPPKPELTFAAILEDLANDGFPLAHEVHNLRLKY